MHTPKFADLLNLWEEIRMSDEIIEELWQIKDAIAHEYGNDINALLLNIYAL